MKRARAERLAIPARAVRGSIPAGRLCRGTRVRLCGSVRSAANAADQAGRGSEVPDDARGRRPLSMARRRPSSAKEIPVGETVLKHVREYVTSAILPRTSLPMPGSTQMSSKTAAASVQHDLETHYSSLRSRRNVLRIAAPIARASSAARILKQDPTLPNLTASRASYRRCC